MRKGQIHMAESVMVIMVFVVILVIGLVFYFQFRSDSLNELGSEISLKSSESLLGVLTSIPEIKCSEKLSESDCVDSAKLIAMKGVVNKYRDRYTKLFNNRKVSVEILYPKPDVIKECTQKEYNLVIFPKNCNEFVLYEPFSPSTKSISVPISLYFPSSDSYGVGRLKVFV